MQAPRAPAALRPSVKNSCNAPAEQHRAGAFCYTYGIMTKSINTEKPAPDHDERQEQSPSALANRKRASLISWIVVAVVAVFIFGMSCRNGYQIDNTSGIFSVIKQWLSAQAFALTGHEVDVSPVGHFCEYLALGAALTNALRFHLRPEGAAGAQLVARPVNALSKWAPAIACALSSVYGVTDEFHQIFTPGRSCDPLDWAVDTVAAVIGALICYAVLRKTKR